MLGTLLVALAGALLVAALAASLWIHVSVLRATPSERTLPAHRTDDQLPLDEISTHVDNTVRVFTVRSEGEARSNLTVRGDLGSLYRSFASASGHIVKYVNSSLPNLNERRADPPTDRAEDENEPNTAPRIRSSHGNAALPLRQRGYERQR